MLKRFEGSVLRRDSEHVVKKLFPAHLRPGAQTLVAWNLLWVINDRFDHCIFTDSGSFYRRFCRFASYQTNGESYLRVSSSFFLR